MIKWCLCIAGALVLLFVAWITIDQVLAYREARVRIEHNRLRKEAESLFDQVERGTLALPKGAILFPAGRQPPAAADAGSKRFCLIRFSGSLAAILVDPAEYQALSPQLKSGAISGSDDFALRYPSYDSTNGTYSSGYRLFVRKDSRE